MCQIPTVPESAAADTLGYTYFFATGEQTMDHLHFFSQLHGCSPIVIDGKNVLLSTLLICLVKT